MSLNQDKTHKIRYAQENIMPRCIRSIYHKIDGVGCIANSLQVAIIFYPKRLLNVFQSIIDVNKNRMS